MNNSDFRIFLGICIQNNDPEMRGRIKVFIPHLSPNVTKLNENVDKFFTFIGKESNNDITSVLEELKGILPWAEYAGPIMGGNASGRYNATTKIETTSDSNSWDIDRQTEGFRPAQNYVGSQAYNDAFTQNNSNKNLFVNQYSYQYTPSNYSGLARGLFSIPNVGAHVYVFFVNGDRNFPVYFASAYSQDDVKRIFTLSNITENDECTDYPKSYENIKKSTLDSDSKTFRSKTVLNSNKNTIELIDTDLKETIKFTHYSGSFKEFNNYANIEFATNNDQKLVIGDQFLTVKRNKSEFINGNNELIVFGDKHLNVGQATSEQVKEIVDIYKQIHDYKMLFNIQRVQYGGSYYTGNPNILSTKQKKVVSPLIGSINSSMADAKKVPFIDSSSGHTRCPSCQGKYYDPFDPEYGEKTELWMPAPLYNTAICMSISTKEQYDVIKPDEANIVFIPQMQITTNPNTGKVGYYRGDKCSTCNGTGFVLAAPPGYSPSSENGMFVPEPAKVSGGTLDQTILKLSPKLFDLENKLNQGGDEIINISMSKIETIGLSMNDMLSYRVDPIGKIKIDGCTVAPQGTYESFRPSPHVEYVDVDDIPGGDYILTATNKYKLMVGAKGINIQTYGPIDIYGTITNFNSEQMNIASKNEILVDGGERLSLRGRKIALLPIEQNAVVVEGQLHVTRNSIFQGGMMIEGEVALLHVTAPLEWQQTEVDLYDITQGTCTISPVIYNQFAQTLTIPRHTHWFKNLPLTLTDYPEQVREQIVQKGINSRNNIAAASRTSNPSACSTTVKNAAQKAWEPTAMKECQKQAAAKGHTTDWTNEAVMLFKIECQNKANTGTSTTKIVTAKLTWKWSLDKDYGFVTISGDVTSTGQVLNKKVTS